MTDMSSIYAHARKLRPEWHDESDEFVNGQLQMLGFESLLKDAERERRAALERHVVRALEMARECDQENQLVTNEDLLWHLLIRGLDSEPNFEHVVLRWHNEGLLTLADWRGTPLPAPLENLEPVE